MHFSSLLTLALVSLATAAPRPFSTPNTVPAGNTKPEIAIEHALRDFKTHIQNNEGGRKELEGHVDLIARGLHDEVHEDSPIKRIERAIQLVRRNTLDEMGVAY
jgi:hypothetical protein